VRGECAVTAPPLPAGRRVELPRRGTTFIRELPGPADAGERPTLVLLHGWAATADLNWFRCYEALGARYRVIALDQRGHGRGIRSRRVFRLEDCADDAAALATELGLRQVVPVGYSLGGAVAQLMWRRHRELVSGLVLCATSRNFGRGLSDQALFASLLGLSGVVRLTPGPARRRLIDEVLRERLEESPYADWIIDEVGSNDAALVLQAGWALGRFNSSPWVVGVDVAASVVVTTRDQLVSPYRQLKLARAIPGSTMHAVAADHAACVVDADRFVPALLSACDDVSRSPANLRQ
jgi:3-oxoadipate enol-lactonase